MEEFNQGSMIRMQDPRDIERIRIRNMRSVE